MTMKFQYDRDLKSGPLLGELVDAAVALLR